MKIQKDPSTILFPVPAVLVSCRGKEKDNVMTVAWTGTVCSIPPMLSISIRPPRYSHDVIKESGEFVVNLPTADMLNIVDGCGTVSGRDVDKFEKFALTKLSATEVNGPMIEECPVNIECKTKQFIELGAHDLFLAEIVAVHISEDVLTNGKLDFERFKPLAYLNGEYRTIAEKIGTYGFTAKK